ncbi:hypothetical protein [Paraburkholderia megapolitana]|uniref:hypothetical protein n=1 Tax=Paraburkholderia megapolitana TaxID=420953 RepID=UPI0038B73C9B
MNETTLDKVVNEDRFAVAQVILYLFAFLQVLVALGTGIGGASLEVPPQGSMMQRVSATTSAIINILSFAVGYVLLARCLYRCTTLVWRIAMCVFLINAGVAVLAFAARPNPYPVLTFCLSISGAISVWRGRSAMRPRAEPEAIR